ncbi:hypothetical protein ABEB36_006233 [Hypothenemus hampei]|uniref:Uncharacterized protein n=1 Tax=Hypothenemus hampei TaxID=57062 RepID=A0ABD1EPU9_HYPHA
MVLLNSALPVLVVLMMAIIMESHAQYSFEYANDFYPHRSPQNVYSFYKPLDGFHLRNSQSPMKFHNPFPLVYNEKGEQLVCRMICAAENHNNRDPDVDEVVKTETKVEKTDSEQ